MDKAVVGVGLCLFFESLLNRGFLLYALYEVMNHLNI